MMKKRIAKLLNCFIATLPPPSPRRRGNNLAIQQFNNRLHSGFTLLELIIAVALVSFLSIAGIVAYRNYNQKQVLETAAYDLASTIQLAKSRAISQVKPFSCAATDILEGYKVVVNSSATYDLYAVCGGDDYKIGETKCVSDNLSFLGATSASFFFPVLKTGVIGHGTVVLSGYSQQKAVTVDPAGVIKIPEVVPAVVLNPLPPATGCSPPSIFLSTPIIINPPNGSSFGQGSTFTVGNDGGGESICSGGACESTQITVNLPAGLSTTDPNPHDCGDLSNGGNCGKSWQINADICGIYSITVTVSSDTTPSSTSNPISITVTCPGYTRVFMTSSIHTGNMGGLTGADTICQTHADAANGGVGLGGIWKAWLSDTTQSPASFTTRTFTHATVPYKLVDGTTTVASDWNDLTNGILINPINKDENGNIINGAVPRTVWTATLSDGSAQSAACGDWTIGTSVSNAHFGRNNRTDSGWTFEGNASCHLNKFLYCFEQ